MKIAIAGTGISSNAAAHVLSRHHEVTIYEKQDRIGGHSNTVDVDYDGVTIPVDTGFIVYNEHNYPRMTKLFAELGVETQDSDMSFAVSTMGGAFEWSGRTVRSVFAQRRNLFSPGFLFMLREIFRFNRLAREDLETGLKESVSLGDYLSSHKFSARFKRDYLLPMGAAIWSTPASEMLLFPARSFLDFFRNHRLIDEDRPQWRTVTGGSRSYVKKLTAPYADRIQLGVGIAKVTRTDGRVQVTDTNGKTEEYDHIVIGAHSDEALAMLSDASDAENRLLGAVRYGPNKVYLHRDPALMPRRRRAWSAWNYLSPGRIDKGSHLSVTYWMNQLQGIDEKYPLFVTLNPVAPPKAELTFAELNYDHPMFDAQALDAQKEISSLQGQRNTWFCGAWLGYGFHEDGLSSGLDVAQMLLDANADDTAAPATIEPFVEAAE
ncbi:COG2907: Amine oxidase, flavin-containing [Candidatus Phaeomarinobacter ectocarpi]|uniref:COG2907: Amine oxidase, flavin-containing n=1 Tax=Candidatus Phaeomarinibacter ectocarpi TaxID=1458461 RepID=X5MNG7_9HYPH|nr:FAD-dependent oxidoreductase [Candidatus Phaeomarinobacter ectocarpi]CDO61250.1 COG2907: Amine oxidase, flavin-containing [Candidatus Phaeomarinobacter ectocarpi]